MASGCCGGVVCLTASRKGQTAPPDPSPLAPHPEPRHPTRDPCILRAQVFARCINTSPAKSKQFSKGISQLLDEGAVQQLRERGDQGGGGARSPLEPTRATRRD